MPDDRAFDRDSGMAPAPRVHDLAAELLSAAGGSVPEVRGGAVFAMVESADPAVPLRVESAGGGCGGGRRVLLEGDGVALSDGVRPTHLLVRAEGPDRNRLLVVVERGQRGVDPWPREGQVSSGIAFRGTRLDADGVVSGEIGNGV